LSWFGPQPNATTDDEVTPLLTAAAAGSSEIVELLIKKGADVNASAGGGVTPLHVAADHGDERMVDCLLAAGADPNAMDDEDAKPIHAAAAKEFRAVVERLLPLSTPDPSVADWTVDGLLAHADRLAAQEEASYQGLKEAHEKVKEEKPIPTEIAPEKKQAALESKARGDEAFKKKDYMLAVDAYTQVSHNLLFPNRESL
jgi:basic membrane lipoprotein Med (substrate-binding protein (PBP1-ABC) superfamily)